MRKQESTTFCFEYFSLKFYETENCTWFCSKDCGGDYYFYVFLEFRNKDYFSANYVFKKKNLTYIGVEKRE